MKQALCFLVGLVFFVCQISSTVRNSPLEGILDDDNEFEDLNYAESNHLPEKQVENVADRQDNERESDDDDDKDNDDKVDLDDDDDKDDDGDKSQDPNSYRSFSYRYLRLCRRTLLPNACLKKVSCTVSLPNRNSEICRVNRKEDLNKQKKFYRLTKPVKNPTANQVSVPLLDRSYNATLRYFQLDKFNAHWFNVYFNGLLKPMKERVTPLAMKKFLGKDFTSYKDYFQVSDFFKKSLQSTGLPYFKFVSTGYKYYTNIQNKNMFHDDRYFVEQRLAGSNPMTIRRITLKGAIGTNWKDLKTRLNTKFAWGKAIAKITRKKLIASIRSNMLYVVEFPLLSGIPAMPDVLAGKTKGNVKIRHDTNPIAIFAVQKNANWKHNMKVVAIQIDDKPASPVYTSSDGYLWNLAKAQVQSADANLGEFYEHLLKTHLRMEPMCIGIYRHLSKLHPLHEILKFHCRGLIPVNKNGLVALLNYTNLGHVLLSAGNHGSAELLRRGIKTAKWNDIGLDANVEARGMDDDDKVPFYPYRDDGKVLCNALRKFAIRFVRLFYKRNKDVVKDYELQNLINELSADGKIPPYNGMGQLKGLKPSFKTRLDVVDFLHATLWIIVQHSAMGMSIEEYGRTPIWSTKMYLDPRAKKYNNFAYMLPGALSAIIQSQMVYSLSSLHYDSLFDYGSQVTSPKLRRLVERTYIDLMFTSKPILDRRNAARMRAGHLTYPFMVPGWITNSIST